MTENLMSQDLMWPPYGISSNLEEIESVDLSRRPLPESTYDLLVRAARMWPQRTVVTVLPDAVQWREPLELTFAALCADAHRYANLLHEFGIRREHAVAPIAPNCTELIATVGSGVGMFTGRDEQRYVFDELGKLVERWLDTGDLAHVDADGFIYLHGRSKDLIIRGGHNIDPATIEDALLAHPYVAAVGAVGRPDIHAGEIPVAYVTLQPHTKVTEADLLHWAACHVSEPAAVPKSVLMLDTLPITDEGKPYKLGLCADATRRALVDTLDHFATVHSISANVEDGAIVATVILEGDEEQALVAWALTQYAIVSKVELR